jgi:transcriptional regulator with GAF, ATPase, and Fis domain
MQLSHTSTVTEGTAPRLLDALRAIARALVTELDADACVISRAVGDVLLMIAEHTADGSRLDFGQGFLVSDYPATQRVLRTAQPAALTLDDADVDAAEARLLRELGFATLLMLRFDLRGEPWGLVEIYRHESRAFDEGDVAAAREIAVV